MQCTLNCIVPFPLKVFFCSTPSHAISFHLIRNTRPIIACTKEKWFSHRTPTETPRFNILLMVFMAFVAFAVHVSSRFLLMWSFTAKLMNHLIVLKFLLVHAAETAVVTAVTAFSEACQVNILTCTLSRILFTLLT